MSDEVKSPNYWKSLNELAQNDEYKKFVEREFPENATELKDGVSRRTFLQIMGASIALAGFAACRRPVHNILPYANQPEEVVPGVPLYYASAMPFQDALVGLVVESNSGRPSKIEGNKLHPASLGKSNKFHQAALLEMYNPDRSRHVRKDGLKSSYTLFQSFCKQHFSDTGQRIAFISEANSSPTYNGLKERALQRFPNAQWVTYEPYGEGNAFEGTQLAFGQRLRTVNHFDKAQVIVSFDDDFLNPAAHKNNLANTRGFTEGRKLSSPEDDMARLYSIESTFTLTGSNADNRLQVRSSEMGAFINALGARLSGSLSGLSAFAGVSNQFTDHKWIGILADDLLQNKGRSILTVSGEHQPELHAAIAILNKALNNESNTVSYLQVPYREQQNNQQAFTEVVEQMHNGAIDTVVMVGTNPVFTAPSDLDFAQALEKSETVLHLSDYFDETSKMADWHVNKTHFLEAWGDGFSYTGDRSIVQPLIQPLYDGKNAIEFLNTVVTGEQADAHDLIQKTWHQFYPGNFEKKWEQTLHDGVDITSSFPQVTPTVSGSFAVTQTKPQEGIELVIRPDSKLFDGRFANNGWLQELPDPMSKITWDNVAMMSPDTAKKLGVKDPGLGRGYVDLLTISVDGKEVEIAGWVQPGHTDDSITVTVGYGRKGIGDVADDAGVNTYPLRSTKNMFFATNVEINNTGKRYEIACTQDHHSMEGRSLMRQASLQEYRENPDFSQYQAAYGAELPGQGWAEEQGAEQPLSIFDAMGEQDKEAYPDYQPQWGMAIDLNSCIGCGTCTIACQAENNIPVIGKHEVGNGREMHWIRTDRYYAGDVENPKALHQPVPCMHCELAPCEQVCPVAATTHSEDGMNQMTYNRCIGTRYCANNCPYKVRRFNFFNYTKEFLMDGDEPAVIQMAMNPNVTVRFRGVMEKCSYCVQRVNYAKIQTELETEGASCKPPEGSVFTACQQACPSDAIYFGDLTDDESTISNIKQNNRNYLLLEELNTRPRTSYLAKIRNPNPALA